MNPVGNVKRKPFRKLEIPRKTIKADARKAILKARKWHAELNNPTGDGKLSQDMTDGDREANVLPVHHNREKWLLDSGST